MLLRARMERVGCVVASFKCVCLCVSCIVICCHNMLSGADTPAKCHEKLLVRIGGGGGGGGGTCNAGARTTSAAVDMCAFSKCFSDRTATERLSSTSLVLNTARLRAEQPSTYLEEMNTKMQCRFQKAACSTSWPRCGHKTYPAPAASRKYNLLKSCADIKRERATDGMPDVIGALDDLSRTIDAQIVDHMADRHVTLIKVRQHDQEIHGRLEYAKDLMSTDETSEESLKADEEVRSYMMAADCANEDDDDDDDDVPSDCKNLKKLISTVKKNIKQSHNCSQGTPILYIYNIYTLVEIIVVVVVVVIVVVR